MAELSGLLVREEGGVKGDTEKSVLCDQVVAGAMGPEECLACGTQYESVEHFSERGGREGIPGQRNSVSKWPLMGIILEMQND